jgi:hypothetical protein
LPHRHVAIARSQSSDLCVDPGTRSAEHEASAAPPVRRPARTPVGVGDNHWCRGPGSAGPIGGCAPEHRSSARRTRRHGLPVKATAQFVLAVIADVDLGRPRSRPACGPVRCRLAESEVRQRAGGGHGRSSPGGEFRPACVRQRRRGVGRDGGAPRPSRATRWRAHPETQPYVHGSGTDAPYAETGMTTDTAQSGAERRMGPERGSAITREAFLRRSGLLAAGGVVSVLPCGHWSERPRWSIRDRSACGRCGLRRLTAAAHQVGLVSRN